MWIGLWLDNRALGNVILSSIFQSNSQANNGNVLINNETRSYWAAMDTLINCE